VRRWAVILLGCLLLAAVARAAPTPTSAPAAAPASRPSASRRPGGPADDAETAPTRAEKLRRARRVLKYHRRTIDLARAGKYAECRPILRKILDLDPSDSTAWYNMACVHSRLHEPRRAIACLTKALEHGYSDFRHMGRDPDMEPLRDLPGYKALLARKDQIQRERAEKIHAELRERFGEGYICEIDHASKLVFATNIDRQMLTELRDYLVAYATAQWNDLFTYRFEQYVTVVVPAAGDNKRLRARGVGGYYHHGRRMLIARQIGMVMTHEFTHALHHADMDGMGQRHPIWITEGLATLFESSRLVGGHVAPQPNHRLTYLKRLAARGKALPWKKLFGLSHRDFMRSAAVGYSQARGIMLYLHEKRLLRKWYDAYTEGYEDDKTGAAAMEKVFGKPLGEVEADWKRWVRELKGPPLRLKADSACIGVRTRGQVDGLRIVGIVARSGAAKAALAVGDVIVGVDGERMTDSAALLRRVAACEVGDELRIRFRRDGEYRTVTVTLGKVPADLFRRRRPAPKTRPRPKAAPRPRSRPAAPDTPATRPAKKAA